MASHGVILIHVYVPKDTAQGVIKLNASNPKILLVFKTGVILKFGSQIKGFV